MRKLRKERGISLSQLADATQVSKGHLSSIEQGLASITIETVTRLAIGLDISPTLMLGFPEEDIYARILDLVVRLPKRELRRLLRVLKDLVVEVEMED
jgi:transcriptional regulator with XRE-family HTH domain